MYDFRKKYITLNIKGLLLANLLRRRGKRSVDETWSLVRETDAALVSQVARNEVSQRFRFSN